MTEKTATDRIVELTPEERKAFCAVAISSGFTVLSQTQSGDIKFAADEEALINFCAVIVQATRERVEQGIKKEFEIMLANAGHER